MTKDSLRLSFIKRRLQTQLKGVVIECIKKRKTKLLAKLNDFTITIYFSLTPVSYIRTFLFFNPVLVQFKFFLNLISLKCRNRC